MVNLHEKIDSLDDLTAEFLLSDIVFPNGDEQDAWSPELAIALATAFEVPEVGASAVSKADLARSVLLLLAENPSYERSVAKKIQAPIPECFGILTAAAAITTAVMILKTHVLFERDKDGKLYVKIETNPIPTDMLKSLVENLLGLANQV